MKLTRLWHDPKTTTMFPGDRDCLAGELYANATEDNEYLRTYMCIFISVYWFTQF